MKKEPNKFFSQWKVEPQRSSKEMADQTLRAIRHLPIKKSLFDWLEEWLPSPQLLLPSAGLALLTVGWIYWGISQENRQKVAALQWRHDLVQFDGRSSLAGAFFTLNGANHEK